MGLIPPPPIAEVRQNSSEFRSAADKGCSILTGTEMGILAHHYHPEIDIKPSEVVFVEWISPDELSLYPLPEDEAARRGLPSCWGITSNSKTVNLWYADQRLHDASSVDVSSTSFLASLSRNAGAFVTEKLHGMFEITIANQLYPPGEGRVTYEETSEDGTQTITFREIPAKILAGDWKTVACLVPGAGGEPVVVGVCGNSALEDHSVPPPPPPVIHS